MRLVPEDAIEAAQRRTRARARQQLGEIERQQGRLAEAQRLFEAARLTLRQMDDRRGLARCLDGLGGVLSDQGRYDEAQSRLTEALAIYRSLDDRRSEAACLN